MRYTKISQDAEGLLLTALSNTGNKKSHLHSIDLSSYTVPLKKKLELFGKNCTENKTVIKKNKFTSKINNTKRSALKELERAGYIYPNPTINENVLTDYVEIVITQKGRSFTELKEEYYKTKRFYREGTKLVFAFISVIISLVAVFISIFS